MKQVLILSPHFPPINAPDHQRVRMALPYLEEFGWKATVLAVAPDCVEGVMEPLMEQNLPPSLKVCRTRALPKSLLRFAGVGSLAFRAMGQIRRAGETLLRQDLFDLVFFSTTLFPFMKLGPRWLEKFNVPYVLDFQDPWLSDYYLQHPQQRPPGGRFKYGFSRWLAKRLEPLAVRSASQIVSVSSAYAKTFRRRYPDVPAERFTTLAFGAPETDFAVASNPQTVQSSFNPDDGLEHWVYVGRGGPDMRFAVKAFFMALRRYLDVHPAMESKLRIHFIGTDYAPRHRARKSIEPVALECGVAGVVSEQTDRLPYFTTLRCLNEARALFIPGSDDPGYTASKLYPYILARKPLLAVFHEQSSVVEVIRRTGAGKVVTFGAEKDLNKASGEIYQQWFACWPLAAPETDWNAFAPYTAKAMTRRLCDVFDRAVSKHNADQSDLTN